jgi:methyl coenzyme M reductase gamma subunit
MKGREIPPSSELQSEAGMIREKVESLPVGRQGCRVSFVRLWVKARHKKARYYRAFLCIKVFLFSRW